MSWKADNKTYQILRDAERGGYGVVAPVVYNIEHVVACVRAAEAKRAPLIIQVFPWAITATDGLLVRAAAEAARHASVPVAVHLDHAQDEALIRAAADALPFDSIMVDMSHHDDDAVVLSKTRALVDHCHARRITVEAEPGRIEGGEDGIADTADADLAGVMTTAEQVADFVATGIDFLAPAIGNVHGDYGPRGPVLDFERLAMVQRCLTAHNASVADAADAADVRLVLHGTNDFPDHVMRQCVAGGVAKVNVNKLVLDDYIVFQKTGSAGLPLTTLVERGIATTRRLVEWQMDVCGSAGRATVADKV